MRGLWGLLHCAHLCRDGSDAESKTREARGTVQVAGASAHSAGHGSMGAGSAYMQDIRGSGTKRLLEQEGPARQILGLWVALEPGPRGRK